MIESFIVAVTDQGTTWHFNPPGSLHFGGLWKVAVKSTKKHLRHIIGEQIVTFSESSTFLCCIEVNIAPQKEIEITKDLTIVGICFLARRVRIGDCLPFIPKDQGYFYQKI